MFRDHVQSGNEQSRMNERERGERRKEKRAKRNLFVPPYETEKTSVTSIYEEVLQQLCFVRFAARRLRERPTDRPAGWTKEKRMHILSGVIKGVFVTAGVF